MILPTSSVSFTKVPRLLPGIAALGLALLSSDRLQAATFLPFTVADLIASISTANANGQDDIIDLGGSTFSLLAVDNTTDGDNGLPSVLSDGGHSLTIRNGVIERAGGAPNFRLLHVSSGAFLGLESLVLRRGFATSGGAVLNHGTLSAQLVTFDDNDASVAGGAIHNSATGVVTLVSECWFTDNGLPANGGGISNAGSIGIIERSTFSDNLADGGAGISNSGTIASIANNTFSSNDAFIEGGGVQNRTGATITTLSNCTIAGNGAVSRGGGIYNDGALSVLTSTIVAGNAAVQGGDDIHLGSNGTISSESFNFVGTNESNSLAAGAPNANSSFVGTSIAPLNPLLNALAFNGGPTQTRSLQAASQAIDAGDNPLALSTDQRSTSFLRTSGAQTDIGAFEVQPTADVRVTKTDSPDPVTAGNDLTYTVHVINDGPADADAVSWSDDLPPGTTFVSLSSPPGWTCTTPMAGEAGTVSCSIDPLPDATDASFTLVVEVDPDVAPGAISNTATATSGTADLVLDNNSATADTSVTVAANLTITKVDSPDPVIAGNNLSYTITVTNAGPSSASNVSWSDTLPAGTTFVSLSSPGGWSCSTPAVGTGGMVSCSIASLAPGQSVFDLTIAVAPGVASGTVLSNTADLSSDTFDPFTGQETATAQTTVTTSADLSLTKADTPDPVTSGANLVYDIDVTNAGPSAASTVSWSDTLPADTTFVSLSAPGGWSCTTPAVGVAGTVTCSIGSLGPGSAMFTLTVAVSPTVADGTEMGNSATVGSTTPDPGPGANTGGATTTVAAASTDLTITKTDGVTSVEAGGDLEYSIVVTNAGPAAAIDAVVTDIFPTELGCTWTCAGLDGGTCAAAGAGNISDVVDLPAGVGSVTYTVSCSVSDTAFGTISNTASVAAGPGGSDPNTESNSATDTDTVITGASLTATKTASGVEPFVIGGTVTYTIVVTNTGIGPQADAAGDELVDVLPAELQLVSATATSGTALATTATNTVTWNGSLAADASVTITITATILPSAAGQTVENQGTLSFDGDGDGDNDSTALTDDPGVPGAEDPTVLGVVLPASEIPVLSPVGLVLLVGLLAFASVGILARLR